MPTLRDYDWFHWIAYGPSTDCLPSQPDSVKQSYTTATSGDTAAVQMLGSYNWWVAMGEPNVDEYVYYNNVCYQYKGFTTGTAAAAGIVYFTGGSPGTPPPASATCTLCWSNAAGSTDYHTWQECGSTVQSIGLMTNGTVSSGSNTTFFNYMGSPNLSIPITKLASRNGECYEYLGTSTVSTLPQIILQVSDFTIAAQMFNAGECTLCTGGVDEFHEWELCGTSDRINVVGTGQTNTAANNQAAWVLAANPVGGTVVSFNGECYTYKNSNTSPNANGFNMVTLSPIAIYSNCTICTNPPVSGCMTPTASNYNPLATVDDGSCLTTSGCIDPTACNYNPAATVDDGSCIMPGCTDPTAGNYDALAGCDDGSCIVVQGGTGCTIAFGTEICQPDGTSSVDIDLSSGTGLLNVVTTVNGITYGTPTGCATPPVTIPVTGLTEGQTISVQGECSYTKEDYDAQSGGTAPSWAAPNCGESTQVISNETKVYVYYDGTSMGADKAKEAYKGVMDWLLGLSDFTVDTVHGSSTQNVFHTAVGGERWVDWAIAPMTGAFMNRQTPKTLGYTWTDGGTNNNIAQTVTTSNCHAGSHCYKTHNPTTHLYEDAPYGMPMNGSRMLSICNWAHNKFVVGGTASGQTYTWNVDPFYDTADGPGGVGGLIGQPMSTWVYGGKVVGTQNGTEVYLGLHPPAGANDILVICFLDEAAAVYHSLSSSPNWNIGETNETHVGGQSTWTGLSWEQPTLNYKDDYDEFKVRYNAHTATGKTYKAFFYPSKAGSCNSSLKNLPSQALGAISSGNKAVGLKDGMWLAGTSPANGCYTSTIGADLDILETSNPYWDGLNPIYGGLDEYGWGINVDEGAFTAGVFVNDLTDFLGAGSTQNICDGSQCINIKAVDENGVPITNYPIKVNGVSAGSTNAAGIVTNTLTSAGAVVINDCFTFSAIGSCFQTLITIEIVKEDFLTALNCILGCTDPDSWNYNPLAGIDDGSCMYPLEEDPRDSMSRCELLKIDTECQFATDVYNLYKSQRYGLDKGCLYNMDGHATKKYSTDWTDNLLLDYGAETMTKKLHTKGVTPKPDWVDAACGGEGCNDSECIVIIVKNKDGDLIPDYEIVLDGLYAGKTDEYGELKLSILNAAEDNKHKLNLCHCFTTTGGCNSQRITLTVDGIDCCGENIKMF